MHFFLFICLFCLHQHFLLNVFSFFSLIGCEGALSWLKGTNIDVSSAVHLQHLSTFVSLELVPVFLSASSIWQMQWDLFWQYRTSPPPDVYDCINTALFVSPQLWFYPLCICVCSRGGLCTFTERERTQPLWKPLFNPPREMITCCVSIRTNSPSPPRVDSVALMEITEYAMVGGNFCHLFKIFLIVLSSYTNSFYLVTAPYMCCCSSHEWSLGKSTFFSPSGGQARVGGLMHHILISLKSPSAVPSINSFINNHFPIFLLVMHVCMQHLL